MFQIRKATPEDAEATLQHLREIADEPDNNITYSAAEEIMTTIEEQGQLLAATAESDNSMYVVAVAKEGQIVGVANLIGGKRRATRQTAVLAITVKEGWRDKGVGKQMMTYMLKWAREASVLHRIELRVDPENQRAVHLYEQMGFVHEGRLREDLYKYGRYRDTLVMGLLLV